MSAFVPNCDHGHAVRYNDFNKVVQCHVCGQVWIPLVASTDEEYVEKVKIEQERLLGCPLTSLFCFWEEYQRTGAYQDMLHWLKHRAYCYAVVQPEGKA